MCGIAGRVNFVSREPVERGIVTAMCDLVAHRGPDGSGVVTRGFVGLGHRRLAIIDLSEAGRQPMSVADDRLWITFNGEIYNYQELRATLQSRGYQFRTQTDTEVILHAYREYGLECVQHLHGMFAFAIWDDTCERLLLARDRVGKKPLIYRIDGDGIAFASEAKAFLAEPSFRPGVDAEALSHYLTYQYVPAPMSAFAGVRKLPPAHCLVVERGQVNVQRYWRLRYAEKRDLTKEEAAEQLRDLLKQAVKSRLISDVPLGAFLSGGIDSGSIVAMMAELGSGPVKTFSIGFEEKEYDELAYARLVASRYGTDHTEFVVRPDALSMLDRLVWHYNEPYADSSAIPTFVLSELTRRHVTVALNGDGGDESFAGYERYRANVLAERYDRLPAPLRASLRGVSALIPPGRRTRGLVSRGKRFIDALSEGRERRYVRWMAHFDAGLKEELCTPEFRQRAGRDAYELLLRSYAATDATDFVDATLDVDVNNYLPDDLLVKVDIATMAHGLEGRSPFLDHRLMEFAASLPSRLKLNAGTKKYILKRAVAPYLPREILDRPKMGFGVPLDSWFRGELRELAYDVLLSRTLRERGYFRESVIRRLLEEHVSGQRTWHYQLWNLLMLELWHRAFIDSRPDSAPRAADQQRAALAT